jgi:hypothetical protein
MRQDLRPAGSGNRSAAAPATVTGKVCPCHWPQGWEGGQGAGATRPDIRKPGNLPAPELKRADGVFRDLRIRAFPARPRRPSPPV